MTTKTDRELLELAAHAAGKRIEAVPQKYQKDTDWLPIIANTGNVYYWNPITDDGAAFRLAVELKLSVWLSETAVTVESIEDDDPMMVLEIAAHKNEYAATRRAIVLVAAAIGQSMKDRE